jgi:hypothetical protein
LNVNARYSKSKSPLEVLKLFEKLIAALYGMNFNPELVRQSVRVYHIKYGFSQNIRRNSERQKDMLGNRNLKFGEIQR